MASRLAFAAGLMPRKLAKPAKQRNPLRGTTPDAAKYRPGDHIEFALDHGGGPAMVIGYDAEGTEILVVLIGEQFVESDAADCSPIGSAEPPLGASHRRAYMKRFPGKLKP